MEDKNIAIIELIKRYEGNKKTWSDGILFNTREKTLIVNKIKTKENNKDLILCSDGSYINKNNLIPEGAGIVTKDTKTNFPNGDILASDGNHIISKKEGELNVGNSANLGGKPASDYATVNALNNYYTKTDANAKFIDNTELTNKLADYTTNTELTTKLDDYYTKEAADAEFIDNTELTTKLIDYATREELTREINPTVVSKANIANLANDIADNISVNNFTVTGTFSSTGNTNLTKANVSENINLNGVTLSSKDNNLELKNSGINVNNSSVFKNGITVYSKEIWVEF